MDFDLMVSRLRSTGHAVIPLDVLDALADRAGYAPSPETPGRYRDFEGCSFDAWPEPGPIIHRPRRQRPRRVAFRDLL